MNQRQSAPPTRAKLYRLRSLVLATLATITVGVSPGPTTFHVVPISFALIAFALPILLNSRRLESVTGSVDLGRMMIHRLASCAGVFCIIIMVFFPDPIGVQGPAYIQLLAFPLTFFLNNPHVLRIFIMQLGFLVICKVSLQPSLSYLPVLFGPACIWLLQIENSIYLHEYFERTPNGRVPANPSAMFLSGALFISLFAAFHVFLPTPTFMNRGLPTPQAPIVFENKTLWLVVALLCIGISGYWLWKHFFSNKQQDETPLEIPEEEQQPSSLPNSEIVLELRLAIIQIFLNWLNSLANRGWQRPTHQTSREHLDKIQSQLADDRLNLNQAINIFEEARYNTEDLNPDHLKSQHQTLKEVLNDASDKIPPKNATN